MRQIVLDTETTGLDPREGHRLIEIGCVELIDRRLTRNNFHQYLQPDREIDADAVAVHGIENDFLRDKPRFAEVAEDFLRYVTGSELIIHNAAFDIGFLDHELVRWRADATRISDLCEVNDTLLMARRLHPGQRNSLDALCKRYGVDNSHRDLHGALLDAEILADVYLAMTGGQVVMHLGGDAGAEPGQRSLSNQRGRLDPGRQRLPVIAAGEAAQRAHAARLAAIDAASADGCLWLRA
ncbi:MAG: DNA polymerase III subunit epsilon [Lamprocystis purpurea]|jgi:DNA polymerase-3 subunit epsilon|uniref:DNA polymerase III subunit epsilon n=1 Tax=Lamprocystis purpurea TaxID=61598 RepID=UPI00035FDAC6|nr:DNA polymerase III subunit epsilon [Lamprocystis purpurea]MBV5274533.1 DNA polymerase III subunit epsilon [Lamprocystis purpurea]